MQKKYFHWLKFFIGNKFCIANLHDISYISKLAQNFHEQICISKVRIENLLSKIFIVIFALEKTTDKKPNRGYLLFFQIYNVGNTYTLSIPRAHRYHSGQYTISAANNAGACTGHIRLNVLSKSDIKLPIRQKFFLICYFLVEAKKTETFFQTRPRTSVVYRSAFERDDDIRSDGDFILYVRR